MPKKNQNKADFFSKDFAQKKKIAYLCTRIQQMAR